MLYLGISINLFYIFYIAVFFFYNFTQQLCVINSTASLIMNLLLHNIQLREDRGTEFFISNEIGRLRPSTAYSIAKNLNRIKGYYPEKKRIKKKKKKSEKVVK